MKKFLLLLMTVVFILSASVYPQATALTDAEQAAKDAEHIEMAMSFVELYLRGEPVDLDIT